MSNNKRTVEKYIDSFNRLDHEEILACVTDDVEWILHGVYHHEGKEAFDNEIENAAFSGVPVITVTRMSEEHDVVLAEGTVRAHTATGEPLDLAFCDVFEMQGGKIRKLISYLMEVH